MCASVSYWVWLPRIISLASAHAVDNQSVAQGGK